jgi:tetratricopeptide (TPR) repeat protein
MPKPNRVSRFGTVAIAVCLAALASAPFAAAQSTPPPPTTTTSPSSAPSTKPKVHSSTTVVVSANYTPEEKEADALNKHMVYGPGPGQTDCPAVMEKYPTDLIPAAEKAQFPKNKAKYLYLAHSEMAGCWMQQGRYTEAEQAMRAALEQGEVWPGKTDSGYAGAWMGLSMVQLRQDHFKDAEVSATRAADLYSDRVEAANKEADKAVADVASTLKGQGDAKSQSALLKQAAEDAHKSVESEQGERAIALMVLAASYVRDGAPDMAAKPIEDAYQDALAGKLTGDWMQQILEIGARVAELRENKDDIAKWAARADTSGAPAPGASSDAGGTPKN